ncbi:hypothetical protein CONPUDRAFT_157726 [Coniophora puteana RWD-64-598 SS2]|uniref:ATP-dependent DNA helicase PIF1 n=1 Tax=Coniophora puteana (strain RWD-64-598) TaxID=741705 RepID=A0A5M3MBB2_CONPW|nr:uncharacterized protein CONPUDRAFT_157726 [Coniophora puteana RWD-64-598 SS2]EIW76538.1 hypothetical protein CONPUDRAFT_157726 [Coniophora puteana RWD-64-598 SS2]
MASKTKQPLKSGTTGNAKKRKSTGPADGDASAKKKQPRLDSFFAPRVELSATCGTDKKTHVAQLSDEQNAVLRMVLDDEKSVFFTGSAGTGKSLLLRAIISSLRKKYAKKPDAVAVTASTGMAASNVGGMTIHSWGAVTPSNSDVDAQIRCIRFAKPALQRWKNTKVLIIDEVSMVDGHLFDTLEAIATKLRKKTDKPFGGLQLVVTGDFFQLPPVCKGEPFFAFESNSWTKCIEHTINLTQVFRQKDNKFVDLLNEMRYGSISPATAQAFKALARPIPPPPASMPNIQPTELFPMRHEVTNANQARLRALPHRTYIFQAHDTFPQANKSASSARRSSSSSSSSTSSPASSTATASPTSSSTSATSVASSSKSSALGSRQNAQTDQAKRRQEGLLAGVLAEKTLELKKGAQVMLVKNIDEMLVNGCVGKVVGFATYREVITARNELARAELGSAVHADSVVTPKVEKGKVSKEKEKDVKTEKAREGEGKSDVKEENDKKSKAAKLVVKSTGVIRKVRVDPGGALITVSTVKENLDPSSSSPRTTSPASAAASSISAPAKPCSPPSTSTTSHPSERDEERFPLVEFPTPQGGREAVLVLRDEFRVEDASDAGRLLARRVQVPLVLAWAMSIHKAQGQTIQRVRVDLGRVFEKGQSYVALSRAAAVEGLQVLNFDARRVVAHPKVVRWSKGLVQAGAKGGTGAVGVAGAATAVSGAATAVGAGEEAEEVRM